MLRALFGFVGAILGIAVLIGIGVVIGIVLFGEEEDTGSGTSDGQGRWEEVRRDISNEIDQIINSIEDNEDVSALQDTLAQRCARQQEALREDQGNTQLAERLGDICDEIRSAPENASEQWENIRRQLEEIRS